MRHVFRTFFSCTFLCLLFADFASASAVPANSGPCEAEYASAKKWVAFSSQVTIGLPENKAARKEELKDRLPPVIQQGDVVLKTAKQCFEEKFALYVRQALDQPSGEKHWRLKQLEGFQEIQLSYCVMYTRQLDGKVEDVPECFNLPVSLHSRFK